jgi:hypothetical protein
MCSVLVCQYQKVNIRKVGLLQDDLRPEQRQKNDSLTCELALDWVCAKTASCGRLIRVRSAARIRDSELDSVRQMKEAEEADSAVAS